MLSKSVVCALGIILIIESTMVAYGQEIPYLRELEKSVALEITGAKISKADDASRIAIGAYLHKMRGISAYEAPDNPSIIKLGFDVPDFAKSGDKIWEVRIFLTMTADGTHVLRAILWVNPNTENVQYICGPWTENEEAK